MAVQSEIGLIDELVRLRAELQRREREAADKELQLQRYAADLRETFKQERARAQELRRSYMATVRALSNAVEARDAYTGKHAERVAAYGLVIARKFTPELEITPELEFGYLLHDVGIRNPQMVIQALDARGRRVRPAVILISDGETPPPPGVGKLGMEVVPAQDAASAVLAALRGER